MSLLQIFTLLYISIILVTAAKKRNCKETSNSVNGVGTVLFTAADVYKQCWSPEEIAILTSRMILEDLLPDVSILNIDSNAYVEDLVSYFRLLIEVVKKATHGRKKRVTLLALTDLLGGYLQYAVLPIARYVFYAGLIDYTSIEKLIQLFEELKWFLRTNGQGWPKPMRTIPIATIEPINFETETPKVISCCSRLIFYEKEEHVENENRTSIQIKSDITFPMPFFDSKVRPSSIAVPFKRYALRNIESRKASYILLKFFLAAVQCLKDKKADKEIKIKFQNNFYAWIHKEVIPKMEDDKFYSAFGGILRVEETLKFLGAIPESGESTCLPEGEQELAISETGTSQKHSIGTIILIVMLIIILFWFIIGTVFICCRMRKHNNKMGKYQDPTKLKPTVATSTSEPSKWSLFSSKSKGESKSDQSSIGKCKCSSKTTAYTSSYSSEYDVEETTKKKKSKDKTVTICYPPYMVPYIDKNKPAVIETKTTMKKLPSIEEISEITTERRSQHRKTEGVYSKKHGVKIPFPVLSDGVPCDIINTSGSSSTARSKFWKKIRKADGSFEECWCDILKDTENIESLTADDSSPGSEELKQTKIDQKRLSADQARAQSSITKQPNQVKATPMKRTSKQSSGNKLTESNMSPKKPSNDDTQNNERPQRKPNQDVQKKRDSQLEEPDDVVQSTNEVESQPGESTVDEIPGVTKNKEIARHPYACHSSLTGAYANQMVNGKPIFGYDFETSSSSDLSEEETDIKTSTSK